VPITRPDLSAERPKIQAGGAQLKYDAGLEIEEVTVREIGRSTVGEGKGLVAAVSFRVHGPEAKKLAAEQVPFKLEIESRDLEGTSISFHQSQKSKLQPNEMKYTVEQEIPLPNLGHHELHSSVVLNMPDVKTAHYEGPIIDVVP
jgi:hypothetical protein